MGLDITAYSKIVEVCTDSGDVDEDKQYETGNFRPYINDEFPGRSEGIKAAYYTTDAEAFDFRAGSYSGYNLWREELAKMAGYPVTASDDSRHGPCHAAACWQGAVGPFSELINFSDCEGAIGPVVAAKLAKDFAEWDDRARAHGANHMRFYDVYQDFRRAFEMAADGGFVNFH